MQCGLGEWGGDPLPQQGVAREGKGGEGRGITCKVETVGRGLGGGGGNRVRNRREQGHEQSRNTEEQGRNRANSR